MATYKTISNSEVSNQEIVQLSPSFRRIREQISRNGFSPNGKIVVEGEYDGNELSLDRYLLDNINTIEVPNVRFILKANIDGESFLLTSSAFLRRIVNAYSQNNPYPALTSLKEIIEIDLDPIVQRVRRIIREERKDGVEVYKNTFVRLSYDEEGVELIEVDFNDLLYYINWIVSKPSQNYDERLLDSEDLVDYRLIEFQDDRDSTGEEDESDDTDDDEQDEDNSTSTTRREQGGNSGGTIGDDDKDDIDRDGNTYIVRN